MLRLHWKFQPACVMYSRRFQLPSQVYSVGLLSLAYLNTESDNLRLVLPLGAFEEAHLL